MDYIQLTIGLVTGIIVLVTIVSVFFIAEKIVGRTEEVKQGQHNEK